VQNRLGVDREGVPPALAAGLIIVVAVIGALAYSAGRFGRRGPDKPAPAPATELPPPTAPAPAVAEVVPPPAGLPPTVTPPAPVVIEKSGRSSRVLVEKSSQIVVPLPPGPVATARPTLFPGIRPEELTPRRRIVVEIQATPRPSPTPTVPELDKEEEEEEPTPEETPEAPEPTPRAQPRGSPASI